jgi:hypothetical protein
VYRGPPRIASSRLAPPVDAQGRGASVAVGAAEDGPHDQADAIGQRRFVRGRRLEKAHRHLAVLGDLNLDRMRRAGRMHGAHVGEGWDARRRRALERDAKAGLRPISHDGHGING